MTMAARVLLFLYGIGFVLLGIQFLIVPAKLAESTGIVLPNGLALQEIRAVYGGFFFGTGVYLTLSAWWTGFVRHGLVALAAIMGGLVLGRVLGQVLDGPANAQLHALLAVEAVGFVASLVLLRATGRRA